MSASSETDQARSPTKLTDMSEDDYLLSAEVDELIEGTILDEKTFNSEELLNRDTEVEQKRTRKSGKSAFRAAEAAVEARHHVRRMKVALVNEKIAPELLPFDSEAVNELKTQIERQQNIIDDAEDHSEAVIYQMDLDRIKYMVTDYHRVRLAKIQKYIFHITSSSEYSSALSEQEFAFAKKYLDIVGAHFQKSVLQHLPERYQNLKESQASVPRPNLDKFVFCKVDEDIGEVSLGASQVELSAGDTYIMQYRDLRRFLADGRLSLL
eukprot:g2437.t1